MFHKIIYTCVHFCTKFVSTCYSMDKVQDPCFLPAFTSDKNRKTFTISISLRSRITGRIANIIKLSCWRIFLYLIMEIVFVNGSCNNRLSFRSDPIILPIMFSHSPLFNSIYSDVFVTDVLNRCLSFYLFEGFVYAVFGLVDSKLCCILSN